MTCPDIADRVEALTCKGTRVPGAAALVVDATGVRARVVDLLKSRRMPCRMIPVTITGGDKVTTDGGGVLGAKWDNNDGFLRYNETVDSVEHSAKAMSESARQEPKLQVGLTLFENRAI